ncbi:MAG: sigma-70 family RNA polymerase sigma factor, partial [Ignavibacteria bacterium]
NLIDLMPNEQQPSPDVTLMKESMKKEVESILSTLSEKECEVLKLYFGINGERPATLEEIGEKFNLTRERVRQIKEKAIRSLRHSPKSKALRAYLG